MSKAIVTVHQAVEISFDESKFTPKFMESFQKVFYNFHTVAEHLEHIAQCYARGLIGFSGSLEGYGVLKDMGIELKIKETWTESEKE